jgi:hypothetical protein
MKGQGWLSIAVNGPDAVLGSSCIDPKPQRPQAAAQNTGTLSVRIPRWILGADGNEGAGEIQHLPAAGCDARFELRQHQPMMLEADA